MIAGSSNEQIADDSLMWVKLMNCDFNRSISQEHFSVVCQLVEKTLPKTVGEEAFGSGDMRKRTVAKDR